MDSENGVLSRDDGEGKSAARGRPSGRENSFRSPIGTESEAVIVVAAGPLDRLTELQIHPEERKSERKRCTMGCISRGQECSMALFVLMSQN